jgi:hypothetical protein
MAICSEEQMGYAFGPTAPQERPGTSAERPSHSCHLLEHLINTVTWAINHELVEGRAFSTCYVQGSTGSPRTER